MELDVKRTEQINFRDMNPPAYYRVPVIGVRHLQSLLLFLCVVSNYFLRVNLSVTIVAMTPPVNSTDYYKEIEEHIPIFGWNASTRSVLLSSFFVGYLLANFPASVLGCRYNKKTLLTYSMAGASILSAVSPPVVYAMGAYALMIVRFSQGLCSAFMFPMIHGIMAKWTPPHERSRLVGFVISGIPLGTMITLAVSGVLSASEFGWPSVYYLGGAAGLAWTVLWLLLGAESLSAHRFLGQDEKEYIEAALKASWAEDGDGGGGDSHAINIQFSDIPWKSIFTSLPVWATTVAHVGVNWGFWLLLTEMPTFIHTVLKFDLKEDGMLSALPYMSMFLLQIVVSYVADLLTKRNVISLTTSRKLWNTVATWGAAAGLAALGYLQDAMSTITLYVFIVAIGCASSVGFNINHMDLSVNYAGLLMGITNTVASSGGVVAPIIAGLIVKDQTSVEEWRIVFISGAVVMFLTNLFFILFGTAKPQPWNSLRQDSSKTNNAVQDN